MQSSHSHCVERGASHMRPSLQNPAVHNPPSPHGPADCNRNSCVNLLLFYLLASYSLLPLLPEGTFVQIFQTKARCRALVLLCRRYSCKYQFYFLTPVLYLNLSSFSRLPTVANQHHPIRLLHHSSNSCSSPVSNFMHPPYPPKPPFIMLTPALTPSTTASSSPLLTRSS